MEDGDNFVFRYVMFLPVKGATSDRDHQTSAVENSATSPMCHTRMKPLSEMGFLVLHPKN